MCLTYVHEKTLFATEGWKCFRQSEDGNLAPLFYRPNFVFKVGEWNEDDVTFVPPIQSEDGRAQYKPGFHYSPNREAIENYYAATMVTDYVIRKVRADNIIASGVQERLFPPYKRPTTMVVCVATRIFIEPE